MPFVGEGIATGVAKHRRVGLQFKAEATTSRALDHPGKASGREWRAALAHEHKGRRRTFALQAAQRSQLIAKQRMRAWRPVLDPAARAAPRH